MKVQGPMSNVGSQLRLPLFCELYEKTNGRNNRTFCNFQFQVSRSEKRRASSATPKSANSFTLGGRQI